MAPIQQMFLGVGAAIKTYSNQLFRTFLYKGNGSSQGIATGIDMTSDGGMVWTKSRSNTSNHQIYDTVRGTGKYIRADGNDQSGTNSATLSNFVSTGFSLGSDGDSNGNNKTYASWSWKQQKGYFDVVSYSGTGSAKTVAHSLGCIPGCILIKRTDESDDWRVYHRNTRMETPEETSLRLNTNNIKQNGAVYFNDTFPTASVFTVGTDDTVNKSSATYIAYLFASGESTAATARCVDFDGSGDNLLVPASSDYSFGSGEFTVEGWLRQDSKDYAGIVGVWDYSNNQRSWMLRMDDAGNLEFYCSTNGSSSTPMIQAPIASTTDAYTANVWYHFAAVRTSNTLKLFINGEEKATTSISGSLYDGSLDPVYIGSQQGAYHLNGAISNIRVTKGQALYTSSFRVPTEPLTTTSQGATASNVKLLCCNNSSITGATVSSGTITSNGDPTARYYSPFNDPASFKFGENGNEDAVRCGAFKGNGNNDGAEVFLGWEPQWVLLKVASDGGDWYMWDSIRGALFNQNDSYLKANDTGSEDTLGNDYIEFNSTGFKMINTTANWLNGNNMDFIYIAIRKDDGLIGKPPEAGTEVFNTVVGNGSGDGPCFVSAFDVDMALRKLPGSVDDWWLVNRHSNKKYLKTNDSAALDQHSDNSMDKNNGWGSGSIGSGIQSWMWKRSQGFDLVSYRGNEDADILDVYHNLGRTPEMMWIKTTSHSDDWEIYHEGLNGGTNPQNYVIRFSDSAEFSGGTDRWGGRAPTSTHFSLGTEATTNNDGRTYVAFLFASVSGISKCGHYTGNSSTQTITTGFQPRFLIIKKTSSGQGRQWYLLDTTQGWASGDDTFLELNMNSSQSTTDLGAPTSTGFTLTNTDGTNGSGNNYIYYAHA